jgi:hypothetical protein
LRETAKADPKLTVPFLISIRMRAPRLVLRTACETLPPAERKRILEKMQVPRRGRGVLAKTGPAYCRVRARNDTS